MIQQFIASWEKDEVKKLGWYSRVRRLKRNPTATCNDIKDSDKGYGAKCFWVKKVNKRCITNCHMGS